MKKIFALVLALVMALSLVACGTEKAPDDQQDASNEGALTVAFCQYANLNNWRVTQTNDMEAAIKGAGWNYIYTDAGDDTAQQVADLEDIIAQNPDYIVLAPVRKRGL